MAVIEVTAVPTGTWQADPVHSSVGFSVRHSGIATFRGTMNPVEATLVGGEEPKLRGSVRVENVETQDENLTGHLHSPEFFDVERYPELTFESSQIRRVGDELEIDGTLTIKGVSRRVAIRGTITDTVADAYGNDRLGLALETTIDRTEFGLKWNAPLPGGDMLLANDVRISADLSLAKKAG